jgi:hypothetical protein
MVRAWLVLVALVLGACSVPDLDVAGGILCGNDGGAGGCPDNFECRFGRCCPATGGTGACNPRGLGNACTNPPDCVAPVMGQQVVCLTTENVPPVKFPGGYCSAGPCDSSMPNTSCGPEGVCYNRTCIRRCTLQPGENYTPCRGSQPYSCVRVNSLDPNSTVGVCLPDCTRDPSVCKDGARCFADIHSCGYPCQPSGMPCPNQMLMCVGGRCVPRGR